MTPLIAVGAAIGGAALIAAAVFGVRRWGVLRERRRHFQRAQERYESGDIEAAMRQFRDGYLAAFEGDRQAARTLDNRAIISRVRELFRESGAEEPAALTQLAGILETDPDRLQASRIRVVSGFRLGTPFVRPRSSTRMRAPKAGSSGRMIDPKRLLRIFIPQARPYGFFEELVSTEKVEAALAVCDQEDLSEIFEVASQRVDDDPLLRFTMLELDPHGLRNIDIAQLFTTEHLALLMQELAPLSRGALDAGAAAAILDLAGARAQVSVRAGGRTHVLDLSYSGSRIDPQELVEALNRVMETVGAPRRYGLFDTGGPDMEVACLDPQHWRAIERDRFLPLRR